MARFNWGKVFTRATAALGLAAGLVACGGSDGVTPEAARVMTLAAKADNSYGIVTARSGSTIEMFRGSNGTVTQTLYSNQQTGERVRVFNAADGAPDRVLDERSGNTLTIARTSAERVDYRAYDANGAYLGGYALLSRADGLHVASVTGTPSFAGQLTGQLNGSTQTGSFSLLPSATAGLGAVAPVSPAALALAVAAAGSSASVPAAASARRTILSGLTAGAVQVSGGWVPGLIGGGMMASGLQNDVVLVLDALRDTASLEQLPDCLNTVIDRFDDGASGAVALNDALAGMAASRVRGAVKRAFDQLRDIVSALVDRNTLRALTAGPALGDTSVDGRGVDQSGMAYTLAGNVSASGGLTATATAGDNGAGIVINGNLVGDTLTGTMSGRLGNGTVTGAKAALGQCAVLQQSGGQGTASYAFDAGSSTGTFEFYRNAYSIPDGFRVIANGQTLYDTGGLVSGSETRTLTLTGSRTVFVTVNAPNTGTAWDIRVGCPV